MTHPAVVCLYLWLRVSPKQATRRVYLEQEENRRHYGLLRTPKHTHYIFSNFDRDFEFQKWMYGGPFVPLFYCLLEMKVSDK